MRPFKRCIALMLFLFVSSKGIGQQIKLLEVRNYVTREGHRNDFINAFETKLIDTLNEFKNYVLGQFYVQGADDNFVWLRGFSNLESRKDALAKFYKSEFWSRHSYIPEKHLLNYTNSYLIKPISLKSKDTTSAFDGSWFGKAKGFAVIDFYVANDRLTPLIDFFQSTYDSLLRKAGVRDISYWISETQPNNYPELSIFQDKNLFLTISFYKNEKEYESVQGNLKRLLNKELREEMKTAITTGSSWLLTPTTLSFKNRN